MVYPFTLALLFGCTPDIGVPVLVGMDPPFGYNGETTPTLITGEALYPDVRALGDRSLAWDRQYEAELVGDSGIPLEGVDLLDYQTLAATVPAGLDPGVYDLKVITPSGEAATLPDAFQVTDTRADHLELLADRVTYTVHEPALVHLSLLDPAEAVVPIAEPVIVVVEVVSGEGSISFLDEQTLEDQAELEDETGISGTLGANGEAWFALTSDLPAEVRLTVSPATEDSVLPDASLTLFFEAGEVAGVQIDMPAFTEIDAGEEFSVDLTLVDEDGNPTSGAVASLYLRETCPAGSFATSLFVIDDLDDVAVAVTGATNQSCESNSLRVTGVAEGAEVDSSSAAFQVSAGPAVSLSVVASPDSVVAGTDPVTVWIWAEDAWGNVAEDATGTPVLTDSAGGLDPGAGMGVQECTPFRTGLSETHCSAWLWRSAAAVTLTAEDSSGHLGTSNAVEVLPGALSDLSLSIFDSLVAAGEAFPVLLVGLDSFGNPVETEFSLSGALHFSDDSGPLECVENPDAGEGMYLCLATSADTSDTLVVTFTTGDAELSASAGPFEVTNGPLAVVNIDLGGESAVVAGEVLTVHLTATDIYGNRWLVGTDREIVLTDLSGTLAVSGGGSTTTLDAEGLTDAALIFTAAEADNTITASQAGVVLGSSDPFDVVAGELAEFEVETARTWVWTGEPLSVSLTALDSFGNRIADFDNTTSLRSAGGLGLAVTVDTWTNGSADAVFTYGESGLEDTLQAWAAGSLAGTGGAIDALDASCEGGPTADLKVAGTSPTTLCLASGSTPATTISAAASAAGDAALSAYHIDLGDGTWKRLTSPTTVATWSTEAGLRVKVVVADAAACGDAADVELYIAEADGRPAGPLQVTLADDTLNTGLDTTTVSVVAEDCSGDLADGTLLVWTDLGDLLASSGSALDSTGTGLAVDVVSGSGAFLWSVLDTSFAGTGTLHVGTATGGAYGEVTARISGDSAHPVVLAVEPSGTLDNGFDEVVVRFSEAIPNRYFDSSSVALSELETGTAAIASYVSSGDDTEATFVLESTASPGLWTLSLSTDVRDSSGNRLDGTYAYDGSSSAFSLDFGDVDAAAPDVTGCDPSSSVFRPDGDDGDDEEADAVELIGVADTTPVWWRMDVTDEDGGSVLRTRQAGETARDRLLWDGRDGGGIRVANGSYILRITAEDDSWNEGTSCSVTVSVDNRVTGIP